MRAKLTFPFLETTQLEGIRKTMTSFWLEQGLVDLAIYPAAYKTSLWLYIPRDIKQACGYICRGYKTSLCFLT